MQDPRRSNADEGQEKTVWGLNATDLHSAWWRGQGVQVVVRGRRAVIEPDAEIYLLVEPESLPVFELAVLLETLVWNPKCLVRLSIVDDGPGVYREEVIRNSSSDVIGVRRIYANSTPAEKAVGITGRSDVGLAWSAGASREDAWLNVQKISQGNFLSWDPPGHHFSADVPEDCDRLMVWLVARWGDPSRVLESLEEIQDGVFCQAGTVPHEYDFLLQPLWIGENTGEKPSLMPGPEVIYDEIKPQSVPQPRPFREIQLPRGRNPVRLLPRNTFHGVAKRLIDVLVSGLILVLGMPVFLVVSLAIFVDDGLPIFFGHERQGKGGGNFRCWKFRTMRRNAEDLVSSMKDLNQADGPQVFIADDPRVTRVGRWLRKFQVDEFPQFWNVLKGDMSLVGPRPSPERENQFCPAWREMRLSVRPGITGLWQVSRTRAPGEDFQEWIRFDIEYVQNSSLLLDAVILLRTFRTVFKS